MNVFPVWFFLIPYLLFAFLTFMFLLFNLFHIAKFGLKSTQTTFVLAGYIAAFTFVMLLSVVFLSFYAWTSTVPLDTSLFQFGIPENGLNNL